LKEIHHRVKNNMQVISSLLNLQSEQIEDPKYIEMFNDSRNRIKSMALVHEKLYQSKDLTNINFGDYVRSLIDGLFVFYNINPANISTEIKVQDIRLAIDIAIPCGLIINELISNSLKYAFPEGRSGEIKIIFNQININGDKGYDLVISDNGIGIPENFDIKKTRSLGLQLVINLVEHQLQGKIDLTKTNGTEFHIYFREPKYRKRI
jgi:two-component sensor histidine kinase